MNSELRRLIESVNDAIFMLKDIEKARQLPPMAQAQQQYVKLGRELEARLEAYAQAVEQS